MSGQKNYKITPEPGPLFTPQPVVAFRQATNNTFRTFNQACFKGIFDKNLQQDEKKLNINLNNQSCLTFFLNEMKIKSYFRTQKKE